MALYKDESLDALAAHGNVAQFVSFRPTPAGLEQRFSRIAGEAPNAKWPSSRDAVEHLLARSPEGTVNIRSFKPEDPRSREFIYGIATLDEAIEHLDRLSRENLFLIVNETVDVSDGGISGVIQGGIVEFAPDDTPRCVEKPGVASLPQAMGLDLLTTVYGFAPEVTVGPADRVEFSIHPRPRGCKGTHTLLWERETGLSGTSAPSLSWPNRFSKHIGDKLFGLLMADAMGALVPQTLAIGRRIAPFSFGTPTGTTEVWTRTCPVTPRPGLYTTVKGWTDPFHLLSAEDSDGTAIASLLCQQAVPASYSGAAIVGRDGELIIEGKRGEGDRLMLGTSLPEPLPQSIVSAVSAAHAALSDRLGAVRIEWVHDGSRVWILQLHRGATDTGGDVLVPGEAAHWFDIGAQQPLAEIRAALESLPEGAGVQIIGDIGLTSHVADVVRKRGRPARLIRA
jgi:hypothetical protein